MLLRFFATAAIGAALIAGAHAQNSTKLTSPSGSSAQNSSAAQGTQNIPQEIKQKLSQDGFTNVQVVPGSYLVSAKDKNGDPVMMVIGPHSMTIMSELPNSTGTATTGSSSGSSGLSNGPSNSSTGKMK
jgi:hypothetical protein